MPVNLPVFYLVTQHEFKAPLNEVDILAVLADEMTFVFEPYKEGFIGL